MRILKVIENNGGKIILILAIFVEERLRVAVCHRCVQFRHMQKYCVEQNVVKCPRCAGTHTLSECNISPKFVRTAPDIAVYITRQAATDIECPLYRKRLEIERRKILGRAMQLRLMQYNCQRLLSVMVDI